MVRHPDHTFDYYFYFYCSEGAEDGGLVVLAQHPEAVHLQGNGRISLPKFIIFILDKYPAFACMCKSKTFCLRRGGWRWGRFSRTSESNTITAR